MKKIISTIILCILIGLPISVAAYEEDFSSDPFLRGWETSNTGNYYWDSINQWLHTENYTNSGDWATIGINYNGESFYLSFDIMPSTRDTGDVTFGLFGPSKISSSGIPEEKLYVLIGGYYSQIYLQGHNSGEVPFYSGAGSGLMVQNKWHHFDIGYDSTSKSIDFQVTREGSTIFIWQETMDYGFSNNLDYLGVSMNGQWVTSDRYEVAYVDNIKMSIVPKVFEVSIDIKPGSDPNSINLSSAGVTPVAIFSSDTFDATTVEPVSVSLAGARVKMVGKSGKYLCHEEDVNNDDLIDLVCQVYTTQFMIDTGESTAVLEAETFDGISIRGEDEIRIVPNN